AYHQQGLGQAARLTEHPMNGGPVISAGESEVLMDIGAVMLAAPGATYTVYDAPPSTSFQALFNAVVADDVGVISNSWTYCEDQTTAADAQSLDQIFALAGASGITVVNGSGDTGGTCFDGRPLTVGVPSDAPHAIAV